MRAIPEEIERGRRIGARKRCIDGRVVEGKVGIEITGRRLRIGTPEVDLPPLRQHAFDGRRDEGGLSRSTVGHRSEIPRKIVGNEHRPPEVIECVGRGHYEVIRRYWIGEPEIPRGVAPVNGYLPFFRHPVGATHKGAAHDLLGQNIVVGHVVRVVGCPRDELRGCQLRSVLAVRDGGNEWIEDGAGIAGEAA